MNGVGSEGLYIHKLSASSMSPLLRALWRMGQMFEARLVETLVRICSQ